MKRSFASFRLRRWPIAALWFAALTSGAMVYGQLTPDPPATRTGMGLKNQDSGQPALPSIVQESRAFYVQAVVVTALCGGAIWAVCHSSRRV